LGKYNSHAWKKLKSKDKFVFWKKNYPHSRKNIGKIRIIFFCGKNIIHGQGKYNENYG
jgi:hypothetical protein